MTRRAKLVALALAGLVAMVPYRRRLVCLWRGHRDVRKDGPLAFRCLDCGKRGASLEEFGLDGYVDRTRAYSRENGGSYERGDRWRPTA
jgi:hypothetical protein